VANNTSTYLGSGADVQNGTAPNYYVQGDSYNNVGEALTTLDTNLTNITNNVMNGTIGPVQRTGNLNELALVNATGNGTTPGDAQVLTNLAAGAVNSTSTEAINGSQLFGVANNTSTYLGGGADVQNGTAPTYVIQGTPYNDVGSALGAVDNNFNMTNANVTNLGNSVMNGTIGPVQRTNVTDQLTLVGAGMNATSPGNPQQLTNVANGSVNSTSTDAINGAQLYALGSSTASAFGGNSTVNPDGSISAPTYNLTSGTYHDVGSALGGLDNSVNNINNNLNNGTIGPVQRVPGQTDTLTLVAPNGTAANPGAPQKLTNVAAGDISATSTDAINGSQLYATNANITKLDNSAVKYDLNPDGSKQNSITLQGGDPNAPVVIHNVGDGTADTDAVNVRQLNQTAGQVLNQANSYADQVGGKVLQSAKNYTDAAFGQAANAIDSVRLEAHRAAAIGLAAGSLRYDERPGVLSAAAAGGTWMGATAAAMGLGYTSNNGRIRLNLAATSDGAHWGLGLGVGYSFNEPSVAR